MIYNGHIETAGVWLLADMAGNIGFAALVAAGIISGVVILRQRRKALASPRPGTVVTGGAMFRVRSGNRAGEACVRIDFDDFACALASGDAHVLADLLDAAADAAEGRGNCGETG